MDCGYLHSNNPNHMGGPVQTFVVPPPTFSGGGKPCRFGTNCNNWKNGACTYNHSNTATLPTMSNPRPQQECKFGTACRNFQQGKCTYLHSNNGSMGPQPIPPGPNPYPNPGMIQGTIEDRACRNWMQDKCQNTHCKREHKFINNDSIKRVYYLTEIPT